MNVDSKQLRSFVAVARLGNFTRAAEQLHLSQPSLSLHIHQIERSIGLRLMDRSTRAVALTAAGVDFLAGADRILGEVEAALASLGDLANRKRGHVAVAALPSVAADILPRAIARLAAQHPGVIVTLRDVLADHIVAKVRSGEVDFGVTAIDLVDDDIAVRPLTDDSLMLVAPPDHPAVKAKRVTWKLASGLPFIAMTRDSSVRRLTERAFATNGLSVEPAFEATYLSSAIGLVASRLGVAAMPSLASPMVAQAGLAERRLTEPVITRRIGIVTRRGRSLSPAAASLAALLAGAARDALPKRRRAS